MPTIVVPTQDQGIDWQDIRVGIKNCIKAVVSNAIVYSSWPLKYDIGKTINLLKSDNDSGKVHAWIVGINKAIPYYDKSGGKGIEWELDVRVWGFLGYAQVYTDSTQHTIESEIRAITKVVMANAKHLGMNNTQGLVTDGLIDWNDIDVHAFGSGADVHVAQGLLKVKIREHFSGY